MATLERALEIASAAHAGQQKLFPDAGFSSDIVTAVQALTKTDGESRLEAAHRAVQNTIARQVKLADVADNMDLSRIPSPTSRDHARLEEYKRVRQVLLAGPRE